MSPEAWTFFSAISAGVIGILREARAARRKIEKVDKAVGVAGNAATEAAELSRATGNGFAQSVLGRLDSIKASQRVLHEEIGEVREDLSDHKDMHISEGMQRKRDRN